MTAQADPGRRAVVLGVSGSGKTTLARALAEAVGAGFLDADDLHPPANVAKMAGGTPLTDEDRAPWLTAVAAALRAARLEGRDLVVACSALRRRYRDLLRAGDPDLVCLLLAGPQQVLVERLAARRRHFMPSALLESQLATLEPLQPDERGATLDLALPVPSLVDAAVAMLDDLT